jgi:uncharacterized protein YcnI
VDAWWVTESTTWKIYADSEDEAKEKWRKYFHEGQDPDELDMTAKDGGYDADWGEE